MRHRHPMPFGAEVLGNGETRFSLLAPAAETVDLMLEGEILPMRREDDGLFTLSTEAAPGTRYRYRIDGKLEVPDPASRRQPEDVHGPSVVLDPEGFDWRDDGWKGRPWEETVLYEVHVGTFSPEGTFDGVEKRLGHLADLGVSAIELMPLSNFPGRRNWGYDGVLPYAPDGAYGTPEDLKDLVQTAHQSGMMIFLDVVYNHFGPEGSYLPLYTTQFFTGRHTTPGGEAINFDGEGSERVREFFIHNALYWIEEYRVDGFRLDAVHAIRDDSEKHFLLELAERVRTGPGCERHVHLVLENDANNASYLRGDELYDAQWNDDFHHALHAAITGESAGYYIDYSGAPVRHVGCCLAEGFAYQGEPSRHREGKKRGEASGDLSPTSFVSFIQNHDQGGNRAFGERISALAPPEAVRAAAEVYLLSPQIPMLFMGEEWGASTPFPFFFSDPATRERIPDRGAEETFRMATLDWESRAEPDHRAWLGLYRELLALRREEIVPRLFGVPGEAACHLVGERGLSARWTLGDGSLLTLLANLAPEPLGGFEQAVGKLLHATGGVTENGRELPGWSVAWYLREAD